MTGIVLIYLLFFVFIIFFMVSIIDFMKIKTKNDELLISKLDQLIEKFPDNKISDD